MPDLTECAACGALFDEGLFAAGATACNGCGREFCPECAAGGGVGDDCPRCRAEAEGPPATAGPGPQG